MGPTREYGKKANLSGSDLPILLKTIPNCPKDGTTLIETEIYLEAKTGLDEVWAKRLCPKCYQSYRSLIDTFKVEEECMDPGRNTKRWE